MGNFFSRNNTNKQSKIEYKLSDKILQDVKMEEKQRQEKEETDRKNRKIFMEKMAFTISVYKQIILKHALNKNFKVKLPIEYINNIPVNIYFVFTESNLCGNKRNSWNSHHECYNINLYIFSKCDENKILFNEQLSYSQVNDLIDFTIYSSDCIWILDSYLNKTVNTINQLYNDSYMECFSKDPIIDYYTIFKCGENTNIKFENIYICNECNGQTKNEDLCCFFCKNKNK